MALGRHDASRCNRFPHIRTLGLTAVLLGAGCAPKATAPAGTLAPVTPGAPPETAQVAPQGQADPALAQAEAQAEWIAKNFKKRQVRIPMRDGVELFTTIYTPTSGKGPFPILFKRTPYSTGPYDPESMPRSLGPSPELARSGYIFVYQDVRGKFMSQGEFVNMRPQTTTPQSTKAAGIDESTDCYDSIEWFTHNVPDFNGKVGMWGISYPGFYAAAGMINAHPALHAVSPQAPIADWFFDDFHHHGAFFLPHAFNFLSVFGKARPAPTTEWGERFDHKTRDGYAFFSRLGPLKNANERHLKGEIAFWNDIVAHPNRDAFWQARDLLVHLHHTAPAVMTVGGWYDAEDLYGPLKIYQAVERNNPQSFNMLVMGPWRHGGWARDDGHVFGDFEMGSKTGEFFQHNIEKPFFDHYLKGTPMELLPEAYVFETGSNQWRTFPAWPPPATKTSFYLHGSSELSTAPPTERKGYDAFVSDPKHPVPFTQTVSLGMVREYMIEDQRFADRRADVLSYQTPPLTEDLTLVGEIQADLWVSTSQKDADWVVKVIDVLPPDAPQDEAHPDVVYPEYQRMVRSEVFRGRFRESYEKPKPFVPGRATQVRFPLQDVLHTFKKGHRLMIQVQSTWFPLVDVNPQGWVDNIFEAQAKDFVSAEHRVYHDVKHPSRIEVQVLENAK